jgi:hypothetical protein
VLMVTMQPVTKTFIEGDNVVFSSATNSSTTPSAQWERSINDGALWNSISGETSSALLLSAVTTSLNGYQYRVVFTSTIGSVTSNAAVLIVKPAL